MYTPSRVTVTRAVSASASWRVSPGEPESFFQVNERPWVPPSPSSEHEPSSVNTALSPESASGFDSTDAQAVGGWFVGTVTSAMPKGSQPAGVRQTSDCSPDPGSTATMIPSRLVT